MAGLTGRAVMPDARAGRRLARADGRGAPGGEAPRSGGPGVTPRANTEPWARAPAYADREGRPEAGPSRRQGAPGGEAPRSGGPGVTPRANTAKTCGGKRAVPCA